MSQARPPHPKTHDATHGTGNASGVEHPATPALVPRDGLWEGQVAVVGRTLIEGAVSGSLRGPGELVLGRNSRIEGVVDCDVVFSQGRIIGPVIAHSRAHLAAGTRFEGDLEAPVLELDDDTIWNGIARIGTREA